MYYLQERFRTQNRDIPLASKATPADGKKALGTTTDVVVSRGEFYSKSNMFTIKIKKSAQIIS